MLGELTALASHEEAVAWAQRSMKVKNTLFSADAQAIETAFQDKLGYSSA
jgi:hypothetical protein